MLATAAAVGGGDGRRGGGRGRRGVVAAMTSRGNGDMT